jgi:hypothetical protein
MGKFKQNIGRSAAYDSAMRSDVQIATALITEQ